MSAADGSSVKWSRGFAHTKKHKGWGWRMVKAECIVCECIFDIVKCSMPCGGN